MTRRDCLLAALVALLWGVNFLVIDEGMAGVPPLLFLAIRFVAVVFPAVLLVPRPDVGWRTLLAVGSLMSLGQFGFLYLSLEAGMPPGLAALVLQAQVIFTVVIAAGALGERPTRPQVVGVALGVTGLVTVGVGREATVPLVALLLCLAAALSWGVGNVVARAAGVPGGLGLTVWSGIVVPVPALLLALAVNGPDEVAAGIAAFGWPAALSTLYTAGLASLVGYGIFNTLLSRNPAAAVVPWILLVPPVAMLTSWLVRGDVPGPFEVGGGVVMLVGVLVAVRRPRSRRPSGPAGPPTPATPATPAGPVSPRSGRGPRRASRPPGTPAPTTARG
ncbi:EamA family transporter [Nocardioides sp. HDW12B]|uniref:EamA family transporter n=1 Tax=Nocardioides sp. HDW12B TaxID=2714939 RepID=UPI00140A58B6|nr:EamA family transporter [Nocardioides sp. HDW12B]QIK66095.1 EamA family transporter [Nocardioides sp. HDW12B]